MATTQSKDLPMMMKDLSTLILCEGLTVIPYDGWSILGETVQCF